MPLRRPPSVGGSVVGAATGVFVNNWDGYSSDAVMVPMPVASGLSITPRAGGTGIRVLDSTNSTHNAVSLTLNSGVAVFGGATGLAIEGQNAESTSRVLRRSNLPAQLSTSRC